MKNLFTALVIIVDCYLWAYAAALYFDLAGKVDDKIKFAMVFAPILILGFGPLIIDALNKRKDIWKFAPEHHPKNLAKPFPTIFWKEPHMEQSEADKIVEKIHAMVELSDERRAVLDELLNSLRFLEWREGYDDGLMEEVWINKKPGALIRSRH
jgi:hypothetical protein